MTITSVVPWRISDSNCVTSGICVGCSCTSCWLSFGCIRVSQIINYNDIPFRVRHDFVPLACGVGCSTFSSLWSIVLRIDCLLESLSVRFNRSEFTFFITCPYSSIFCYGLDSIQFNQLTF